MRTKLPHEVKSEETKQKILKATEQMLAQYDFKYLTIRNICEESGAAYGSFYYHFQSKENLLYCYTSELFQKNLLCNPLPQQISGNDYIKQVLWYVEVLGRFCEAAGRDLIGYIYKNCPQEMFERILKQQILPIVQEANQKGHIDPKRSKPTQDAVQLLVKDMEIICKGTILCWSMSATDEHEMLHETLEHLNFNLLYAYCSDQYRNADQAHMLLTEMPGFEEWIKIQGIPTRS